MSGEAMPETRLIERCAFRWAMIGFGWLNIGLGIIGAILPGMPTTVFLLIAAWAFSRSSVRFQRWLWNHPMFGKNVRAWHHHRAIPKRIKIVAVSMMTASFVFVTLFVAKSWLLPLILMAVMVPAAAYILTRASVTAEGLPAA